MATFKEVVGRLRGELARYNAAFDPENPEAGRNLLSKVQVLLLDMAGQASSDGQAKVDISLKILPQLGPTEAEKREKFSERFATVRETREMANRLALAFGLERTAPGDRFTLNIDERTRANILTDLLAANERGTLTERDFIRKVMLTFEVRGDLADKFRLPTESPRFVRSELIRRKAQGRVQQEPLIRNKFEESLFKQLAGMRLPLVRLSKPPQSDQEVADVIASVALKPEQIRDFPLGFAPQPVRPPDESFPLTGKQFAILQENLKDLKIQIPFLAQAMQEYGPILFLLDTHSHLHRGERALTDKQIDQLVRILDPDAPIPATMQWLTAVINDAMRLQQPDRMLAFNDIAEILSLIENFIRIEAFRDKLPDEELNRFECQVTQAIGARIDDLKKIFDLNQKGKSIFGEPIGPIQGLTIENVNMLVEKGVLTPTEAEELFYLMADAQRSDTDRAAELVKELLLDKDGGVRPPRDLGAGSRSARAEEIKRGIQTRPKSSDPIVWRLGQILTSGAKAESTLPTRVGEARLPANWEVTRSKAALEDIGAKILDLSTARRSEVESKSRAVLRAINDAWLTEKINMDQRQGSLNEMIKAIRRVEGKVRETFLRRIAEQATGLSFRVLSSPTNPVVTTEMPKRGGGLPDLSPGRLSDSTQRTMDGLIEGFAREHHRELVKSTGARSKIEILNVLESVMANKADAEIVRLNMPTRKGQLTSVEQGAATRELVSLVAGLRGPRPIPEIPEIADLMRYNISEGWLRNERSFRETIKLRFMVEEAAAEFVRLQKLQSPPSAAPEEQPQARVGSKPLEEYDELPRGVRFGRLVEAVMQRGLTTEAPQTSGLEFMQRMTRIPRMSVTELEALIPEAIALWRDGQINSAVRDTAFEVMFRTGKVVPGRAQFLMADALLRANTRTVGDATSVQTPTQKASEQNVFFDRQTTRIRKQAVAFANKVEEITKETELQVRAVEAELISRKTPEAEIRKAVRGIRQNGAEQIKNAARDTFGGWTRFLRSFKGPGGVLKILLILNLIQDTIWMILIVDEKTGTGLFPKKARDDMKTFTWVLDQRIRTARDLVIASERKPTREEVEAAEAAIAAARETIRKMTKIVDENKEDLEKMSVLLLTREQLDSYRNAVDALEIKLNTAKGRLEAIEEKARPPEVVEEVIGAAPESPSVLPPIIAVPVLPAELADTLEELPTRAVLFDEVVEIGQDDVKDIIQRVKARTTDKKFFQGLSDIRKLRSVPTLAAADALVTLMKRKTLVGTPLPMEAAEVLSELIARSDEIARAIGRTMAGERDRNTQRLLVISAGLSGRTDMVEALTQTLRDADTEVRLETARALAKLGVGAEALVRQLKRESKDSARQAILIALGELNAGAEAVAEAIKKGPQGSRGVALEIAGKLKVEGFEELLRKGAVSNAFQQRVGALRGAIASGDAVLMEELATIQFKKRTLVEDTRGGIQGIKVREVAVDALATAGTPTALDVLRGRVSKEIEGRILSRILRAINAQPVAGSTTTFFNTAIPLDNMVIVLDASGSVIANKEKREGVIAETGKLLDETLAKLAARRKTGTLGFNILLSSTFATEQKQDQIFRTPVPFNAKNVAIAKVELKKRLEAFGDVDPRTGEARRNRGRGPFFDSMVEAIGQLAKLKRSGIVVFVGDFAATAGSVTDTELFVEQIVPLARFLPFEFWSILVGPTGVNPQLAEQLAEETGGVFVDTRPERRRRRRQPIEVPESPVTPENIPQAPTTEQRLQARAQAQLPPAPPTPRVPR